MDNLIVLKTFSFPSEASIMVAFLESQNIPTFLNNEINTQIDPLLSNALGGIQLLIPQSQAELAIKLLKENGFLLGNQVKENKLVTWINKIMGK